MYLDEFYEGLNEERIMKKRTFAEVKEILKKNKGVLRERFKVKEIGIFGSYVKGEQNEESDLDILVEFEAPVSLFEFMDMEEYLKKALSVKVDIVPKKALRPRIGKHILDEVIYI